MASRPSLHNHGLVSAPSAEQPTRLQRSVVDGTRDILTAPCGGTALNTLDLGRKNKGNVAQKLCYPCSHKVHQKTQSR